MNGVVTIELSPKYILISPLGYCLYCVFYATALSLLKESNTFAEKYYTFNENVVKWKLTHAVNSKPLSTLEWCLSSKKSTLFFLEKIDLIAGNECNNPQKVLII